MAVPVRSWTGAGRYRSVYREYAPSPQVRGVVVGTWTGWAGWPRSLRVLPDGCVDLVWNGEDLHVVVTGGAPVRVWLPATEVSVGLRLRCGTAGAVLGLPICELPVGATPLASVWDRRAPGRGRLTSASDELMSMLGRRANGGPLTNDGPMTNGPPINDGPPADDGPPAHGGPPINGGPPTNDGPPAHGGPPTSGHPPANGGPPADDGPPVDDGPPNNGSPPTSGPLAEEVFPEGHPAKWHPGVAILQTLVHGCEPDRVMVAAAHALRTTPVPDVADHLGISERTLRRRLITQVGYGPKQLHRVLRFREFVRRLPAIAHGRTSLADTAAVLGYTDQSHLGRECRVLSGSTPGRLAEMCQTW